MRRRRRDDESSRSRACRCTTTRRSRSGRASSSRATSSSTSSRAPPRRPVATRRPHVPDPAGNRAGAARPGADLAAGRHPQEPADPAPAVRHRGQAGRAVVQRLDPVSGCRPTSTRRSSPTTRWGSSPTISRTGSPSRAGVSAAIDAQPAEPAEPDHRLQHDRQRVRAPERGAREHRRGAAARRWRRRSRRSMRSTPRSRRCGHSREGADPGRQEHRPDDRREPAVHHPAAPTGAAVRAARPDPRSGCRRSRRSRS